MKIEKVAAFSGAGALVVTDRGRTVAIVPANVPRATKIAGEITLITELKAFLADTAFVQLKYIESALQRGEVWEAQKLLTKLIEATRQLKAKL